LVNKTQGVSYGKFKKNSPIPCPAAHHSCSLSPVQQRRNQTFRLRSGCKRRLGSVPVAQLLYVANYFDIGH